MTLDPVALLSGVTTILLGIVAWWCNRMNKQIEDLQEKHHKADGSIREIIANREEREKGQDKRWNDFEKKIDALTTKVDRLLEKH